MVVATTVSQEAEVADLDEAARQHVEQKATNELGRRQRHDRGLACVRIVLPAEAHMTVLKRNQALVGDCYAMGITRQVLQDLLRSTKGWFGVNHPLALDNPFQPADEILLLRKRLQLAMEAQLGVIKRAAQVLRKLGAEEPTEHLHGQEKLPATSNPAGTVGSDAAAGNDAVEMRMVMQILSPGVKHRHEADPRAQMFGVGGDLQEGFGRGAKEHAVNNPLVLEGQGSDHLRQREDDVKVLDRQQLSGGLFEPRRAGCTLALRAMAIAAGAIRDRAVAAAVALFDVATERGGATDRDVPQRFLLASGERSAKRREISWTVDAKNIGQFQSGRHLAGSGSGSGSRSYGMVV